MNDPVRRIDLDAVLRRDRVIVVAALAVISALAWIYILPLAAGMEMGGMDMTGFRMVSTGFAMAMLPSSEPWGAIELIMLFVMWTVMMIGMMTPSVAPMVLIYARAGRVAAADAKPFAAAGWFTSGYLLIWTGFAAAATTAQWALERFALLDPTMASASDYLGGAVLLLAGLYQWTPLKHACLSECQSPLQFIRRQGGFRGDPAGAVGMGARHGLYCLGCCWALMILLFIGGVMNVLWIAMLASFALLEKVVPAQRSVSWLAGTALVLVGAFVLLK